LIKEFQGLFQGDLDKLFATILEAAREPEPAPGAQVNTAAVDADVEALFKAGAAKLGTDESVFIRIFVKRSDAHLKAVFAAYRAKYARSMQHVIESEFSGRIRTSLHALVQTVENTPLATAEQFEAALKMHGEKERDMLSRVALRNHWNRAFMKEVELAYERKFKAVLKQRVKRDEKGHYEDLLVAMVNA